MPANTNGGRGGSNSGYKKKDGAMMADLRGACPPHKKKDLDQLFKQLNGDEAKIMEKIQQWWDEPVGLTEVELWEDVNQKKLKKKQGGDGGGRGVGGGRSPTPGGRGGRGRERGSGRGGGGGRDRPGRGDRPRASSEKRQGPPVSKTAEDPAKPEEQPAPATPVPTPSNAPVLKGAWGARAAAASPAEIASSTAAATTTSSTDRKPAAQQENIPVAPVPVALEANPLDVPTAPTPIASMPAMPGPPVVAAAEAKSIARSPAPSGGNVWATKGSAHLIQAEKQPPAPAALPPLPTPPVPPPSTKRSGVVEPEPLQPSSVPEAAGPALESGLPPTEFGSAGGNAWSQASAPNTAGTQSSPTTFAMPPPPSPAVASAPTIHSSEPPAIAENHQAPISSSAPVPPSPAAHKVLNMGHWETGGGDDSDTIDFGFGSFGAVDNDVPAPSASTAAAAVPTETSGAGSAATSSAAASALSPARPPPGLSIGGMPPMPSTAVMVHELENQLEHASMNAAPKNEPPPPPQMSSALHPSGPQMGGVGGPVHASALPSGITQQSYNQYGMPGMYNYNAAAASGSGFVGMHNPAGPVLASGGIPQQQPGKPQVGGLGGPGQNPAQHQTLPQQGLYGSQPPSGPPSVGASNTDTSSADNGIPPGMPGAIPYANPALHYGQHQFYMGQHQGGIGYNYGYGQFGGVAQGGFGYQQVMGQNQAYGAPHYDDQSHQANTHHSSGSGGYQNKNGGGYRGRNTHHGNNNNQYQNQYNPQQHGGYGGQPYGMGYHGHGPGGAGDPYAIDPYAMQRQGGVHSGGFQEDDHQKGRKGARSSNSSLQQFPQQGQQLGGPQQAFGLQGQGGVDSAPSSGGWPNQGSGGGGWNNSAQSGWQGS